MTTDGIDLGMFSDCYKDAYGTHPSSAVMPTTFAEYKETMEYLGELISVQIELEKAAHKEALEIVDNIIKHFMNTPNTSWNDAVRYLLESEGISKEMLIERPTWAVIQDIECAFYAMGLSFDKTDEYRKKFLKGYYKK